MASKRMVFLDLDGRQHDLGRPEAESEKQEDRDGQAQ